MIWQNKGQYEGQKSDEEERTFVGETGELRMMRMEGEREGGGRRSSLTHSRDATVGNSHGSPPDTRPARPEQHSLFPHVCAYINLPTITDWPLRTITLLADSMIEDLLDIALKFSGCVFSLYVVVYHSLGIDEGRCVA